jgi:spermidine/putrescine transport system permease protein
MIAFAIGRHKFKGRSTSNLLIFLPMATPEIVLGASLLSLFLVLEIILVSGQQLLLILFSVFHS